MDIAGKVFIVTGGASGLGEGTARMLAANGGLVVIADMQDEKGEAVAKEIGGAFVRCDVSNESDGQAVITKAMSLGKLMGLVNCAGIETLGKSWDIAPARWQATLDINVMGAIHGVHAFVPAMLAAGEPAFIANVASVGAFGQMPMQAAYITSKHALQAFAETLALEIGLTGKPIHVASVIPGAVATAIFDRANKGDAAAERHRAIMQAMLAASMAPADAARIIFARLAARDFFIMTHPDDARAIIAGRIDFLSKLAAPALPDQLRALLHGD